MNDYIKVNEEYVPVTYVTRPYDSTWNMRESIELTASVKFQSAMDIFKGGKWSLYEKIVREVPDEPVGDETPTTFHEETEYKEADMSDYCVCGWVRDNLDGTCSVKMGKLSELEAFMEAMLGGV